MAAERLWFARLGGVKGRPDCSKWWLTLALTLTLTLTRTLTRTLTLTLTLTPTLTLTLARWLGELRCSEMRELMLTAAGAVPW